MWAFPLTWTKEKTMLTTSKTTRLAPIMLSLGLVAGSSTFADARFRNAGDNSRGAKHIATHESQEARIHFPGGLTATAPKPQSKPGDTGRPAPNLGSDGSGSNSTKFPGSVNPGTL